MGERTAILMGENSPQYHGPIPVGQETLLSGTTGLKDKEELEGMDQAVWELESPHVPKAIAPLLQKCPPMIQRYVKAVCALPKRLANGEKEFAVQSLVLGRTLLSIWTITSFPCVCIFVALLVAADPPSFMPLTAKFDRVLHEGLLKLTNNGVSIILVGPGAVGLLATMVLLSYLSWYLGCLVWVLMIALACISSADRVIDLWMPRHHDAGTQPNSPKGDFKASFEDM